MMTKKRNALFGTFVLLVAFLSFNVAFGQVPTPSQPPLKEDFEQKELTSFLNANAKISEIQMEAQGEMVKIIEAEGISVEKFNQIAQSQQQQYSTAQKNDPKDMESFQKAAEKITGMQQTIEGKMIKTVEGEGLDVNTYQQIAQAYQQSPKVKGQLDKMMEEQLQEKKKEN
ncbi:DUF4168 domain-containing protein [Parapedobacter tibetensis]|uniref:DUF4168 domain-containing protein n=1 Tax=Parapedobacter tibetensis TaxID=2972951 RepID=UPI00214D786E|nr:DUF4168 domain-containing protein [Parapedobacter tibetensis]